MLKSYNNVVREYSASVTYRNPRTVAIGSALCVRKIILHILDSNAMISSNFAFVNPIYPFQAVPCIIFLTGGLFVVG